MTRRDAWSIDRSTCRSLNLTWSAHRQPNERTFTLDRDRARRDVESHRSVRHQEDWDAGTSQPGKAFTSFRERTPYLDTSSAVAVLPRNLPGHSSVSFCGRTGSERRLGRNESSDIPKTSRLTDWSDISGKGNAMARAEIRGMLMEWLFRYVNDICESKIHRHHRPSLVPEKKI